MAPEALQSLDIARQHLAAADGSFDLPIARVAAREAYLTRCKSDDLQGTRHMSDDYCRLLNVIGLAFNLIGVLVLFRWGMPFRVASGGVPTRC